MTENSKLTNLAGLEMAARRLKSIVDEKGGIETVKLNGVAVAVEDKAVNLEVPTQAQLGTAVNTAMQNSKFLRFRHVGGVSAIDPSDADAAQSVYIVLKKEPEEGSMYDKYIVVNGSVERLGEEADLSGYVQKQTGKGLSTNDYTTVDRNKLAGVAQGATKVEASEGSGVLQINDSSVTLFELATDEEIAEMLDNVFSA